MKTFIKQKITKEYIENENDAMLRSHLITLEDIRLSIGTSPVIGITSWKFPIFNVRLLVHFWIPLNSLVSIDFPFSHFVF